MLLFLLACSGGGDSSEGPPGLTLLSPADGDTVCGNPLAISTQVDNFVLTDEPPEENTPSDRGHVHVYLNGQEVATSYTESFTLSDVSEGKKQLRVELGLTNHEALDPYVGTTIYVTIDNSVCGG